MSNIPFIDIEGGGGGSDIQLSGPPIPTPNYGILSLGGGPFDGVTTGYFKGSANGTAIGVNLPSGSTSDLLNAQVAGVSAFKLSASGSPLASLVSPAAATVPLVVKGATSQSVDYIDIQESTGTTRVSIGPTSFLKIIRPANGAHAIEVTDGTTYSNNILWMENPIFAQYGIRNNGAPILLGGTTDFGVQIQAAATHVGLQITSAASQTADLQQWQSNTGAVLAKVDAGGTILTSTVQLQSGGQIYDLPGAVPYFTFVSSPTPTVALTARLATNIPFTIRGAASQTADLQQWQSSTGTVLAKVDANGNILNDATNSTTSNPRLLGAINMASGNAIRWQFGDQYNSMQCGYGNSTRISSALGLEIYGGWDSIAPTFTATTGCNTTFVIHNTTDIGVIVKGATSQTADLQQWQSSAATVLARVDSSGAVAPQNGARLTSGSGAPTKPGGLNPVPGDVYLRVDTPTVASQRIYVCSVGGATPTWIGIA